MNTYFEVTIFVIILATYLYGYFMYPILLFAAKMIFQCKPVSCHLKGSNMDFTLVISVRNESARIKQRLDDLFGLKNAHNVVNIILVDDGSKDLSLDIIKRYPANCLKIISQFDNSGKPFSINNSFSLTKSSNIIMVDARQQFDSNAILSLTNTLSTKNVGAVSGQLFPSNSTSGVGVGLDTYWRIEKFIRNAESEFGSCIGCTGAIYALDSSLFQPLPSDTILDDVVTPMEILKQQHQVRYDLNAIAFDKQQLSPQMEMKRKNRTIAGNFQMLFRYPSYFFMHFPINYFYLSHKVMRLVSPLLIPFMLLIALMCLDSFVFQLLLYLQVVIIFTCVLSAFIKSRVLSKIGAFAFMNILVYSGLYHYLKGTYRKGW